MRLFNKENKNKETRSLPMGKKSKSALTAYSALVLMLCCCTTTAFAASDPLTVINNLSDFIFGLIRAIGMIHGPGAFDPGRGAYAGQPPGPALYPGRAAADG